MQLLKAARKRHFLLITLVLCLILSLPAFAALISTKEEISIGKSSSQKIEKQYGLVKDQELCARINALGQRLASHGGRGIPYSFKVLNQDVVNAFAFPGGFVYVTKGICKVMNTNQLSFVLGHEITHVEKRHSVKAIERALAGQVGTSLLFSFIKGSRSQKQGAATLMGMTNTVISNRYSQAQEFEADAGGLNLMTQAGFDPAYGVSALNALKKNDNGKGDSRFMNSLLGTHPLTNDRIKAAEQQVAGLRSEFKVSEGESAADELE